MLALYSRGESVDGIENFLSLHLPSRVTSTFMAGDVGALAIAGRIRAGAMMGLGFG